MISSLGARGQEQLPVSAGDARLVFLHDLGGEVDASVAPGVGVLDKLQGVSQCFAM